jgi:putative transposase
MWTCIFYGFLGLLEIPIIWFVMSVWWKATSHPKWRWTDPDSRDTYVDIAKTMITASGIAVALLATLALHREAGVNPDPFVDRASLYWSWRSRHPQGRPSVSKEVIDLIRKMSLANPRWGAPRIHGELLKLGLEIAESTVAKYMVRRRKPPSQTWRTFLANHSKTLVSSDFFVVPTAFFKVFFVFVILSHDRRRPVHVAVTEYPTSEWVAHQLFEAFPWDSAPRYLLRDRDGSYGEKFSEAARRLGIREVLTAAQSPWQNSYVERLIGSIRRECLDHVIVLNESGLRRILKSYFEYYEHSRTHLSLAKDAPVARPIQPVEMGRIVAIPQVGGLHHRYERVAA